MKKNGRFHNLITLSCWLFLSAANAQTGQAVSKEQGSDSPLWIKMIDDPNTNYYEAVKAYEAYWKHREKPEDEEELMNEGKENVEKHRKEKKLTPAERNERDQMRYQCKRFEQWEHEVFPFVQPDGRILSQEERMKIWKDQQEQLRKQEGK